MLQLVDFCSRVAPKKTSPEVSVHPPSGMPSAKFLEKLTALQQVAAKYLREHGAALGRGSPGWSAALASAQLPPLVRTEARVVSTRGGTRRFLVVHERWLGSQGCATRFTFHLSDSSGRYAALDRAEQAQVKDPLRLALEVACRENAEQAYLHLGALKGVEVSEVVLGQLGPFEAPRLVPVEGGALGPFLLAQPGVTGVLHLVLERAAGDVASDRSLDPFVALDLGAEASQRRAALGFRVSRERRLCCPPELHRPLQEHLATLGASLIIRSK